MSSEGKATEEYIQYYPWEKGNLVSHSLVCHTQILLTMNRISLLGLNIARIYIWWLQSLEIKELSDHVYKCKTLYLSYFYLRRMKTFQVSKVA